MHRTKEFASWDYVMCAVAFGVIAFAVMSAHPGPSKAAWSINGASNDVAAIVVWVKAHLPGAVPNATGR